MKIHKYQKGRKIVNTLDELGELFESGAKNARKGKRPRINVNKQPSVVTERVEYTPPTRFTADEKRLHNAWEKYKNTGVYATMPEEQAYKWFVDEWNFRHDLSRELIKDLNKSINHSDFISGTTTPEWIRNTMIRTVKQHPSAFWTKPPAAPKRTWPTLLPTASLEPDFYKPQQYRNINNIDTMFEQAESMSALNADDAAKQFLSAGLSDVAAIAKGLKPTSFKYKPAPGIVPINVLEEIVSRRSAPIETVNWLTNINAKHPNMGTSYLDLIAKHPTYFKQMFKPDGTLIK